MHIHWKIDRLDEGGWNGENAAEGECLFLIEGKIQCDGQPAGLVDAYYIFTEDPESASAFMRFWDLDGTTCQVFEEISSPNGREFRDPIPAFLGVTPGILYVNFIALHPQFRRRGLGREALGELVRNFADDRVGMVLLNAQPLQHLPHGYDHFGDEVRDLPWNSPEEDLARLIDHFRSWGMHQLPGTRYLLLAPEFLSDGPLMEWYPSLLSNE